MSRSFIGFSPEKTISPGIVFFSCHSPTHGFDNQKHLWPFPLSSPFRKTEFRILLGPLYHEFCAKTARNQKNLFVVLSRQKSKNKRKLVLKFSKKDFEKMTNKYCNIFALGNKIVSYRQKKNGVYEARYHRNASTSKSPPKTSTSSNKNSLPLSTILPLRAASRTDPVTLFLF